MTRLAILSYRRVAVRPVGRRAGQFVRPDRLREQLDAILGAGYTPVTFAEWSAYRAHRAQLPRRPFLVTFDGGYDDFDAGWPILRECGVPATVFLVASRIGGTNDWDPHDERTRIMDSLRIRELEAEGVSFGGCGYTHAILTRLSPNDARVEIERCRAGLVAVLAHPPAVFAYPDGAQNGKIRRLVKAAGFSAAVRGGNRWNGRWSDPYNLRRIAMDDAIDARALRRTLTRLVWL